MTIFSHGNSNAAKTSYDLIAFLPFTFTKRYAKYDGNTLSSYINRNDRPLPLSARPH